MLKRRRALSEDPETLWGICQTRYFRSKLSIRSPDTKQQYRTAIADMCDYLGRNATKADLAEETIVGMMKMLSDRGCSPACVNERRGRFVALWNWLAKKREMEEFPMVDKLPEPRRVPKSWSKAELEKLFASCKQEPGELVPGVLAADYWLGLHGVLWDSGERIGALLATTWEMLNVERGELEIPAEVRKGRAQDMLYSLHPSTMGVLERMKPAGYSRIFAWPYNEQSHYRTYCVILQPLAGQGI